MTHILLLPVYIVLAAFAIWTIGYFYLRSISRGGLDDAVREVMAITDITEAQRLKLLEDIEAAAEADDKTVIYDWLAPIVVPFALLWCKETDTKLPKLFSKWDNNVSINGDGTAVLRDGKWLTLRDGIEALPGERIYSYDDPEYTGPAYYAIDWLHWISDKPRSFVQRWGWLGFRNRASQYSVDLGVDVVRRPWRISGDGFNRSTGREGYEILTDGESLQYRRMFKTKKFGFTWAGFRNAGYKLDTTNPRPDSALGRVAAVAIGLTLKGWKAG